MNFYGFECECVCICAERESKGAALVVNVYICVSKCRREGEEG